ncbi:uncharacterized protein DUF58 [Roseimicrobium gellanilyticum]|uniref:Uncharacterized protein DUF58 n=1 Tax=Roseimicrobium gellanilyticum TaxID=748857 RepID=A0A366HQI0_9BACT|nr:DUF58 domain-containing protein [Roseimicrobium gellanilyticum]RBP45048.1 uncharacterized protein DUF58 [Roseimicrobium gellanilyticum]
MNAKYLRPEDARQLRAMTFSPHVMVEGTLSGQHRSRLRGASTEFHEYRPYSPGDPPAQVDWRVFARTDRFYLKTFELETHLECHIFLDISSSMGFSDGPESKYDWAARFAAGLAYLVTLRQDRVSLTVFNDRPRGYLPPGGTQGHLRQFLNMLEEHKPGDRTALAEALERSLPLLRRKGTVIILSDFLDEPSAIFRALSAYMHRGFKVFLYQVLTPEELTLPDQAFRRYVDVESNQNLIVHPESVREAYLEELDAHQRGLAQLSTRRGISFVPARTDQPWMEHLRRLAR